MTTIVRAHGGWDNAGWTFVPDGATIKFFSDNNENLITANALSVLAKGNFSNANQTYGPGNTSNDEPAWVPNYELEARSSGEMQRDLSAFAEGADLVFVGDDLKSPIKLCEDTTGQCKDGVHECSGVLGQVKDTDIVYLACRGIVTDADSTSTEGVGAPEERSTETLDFIREMYGLWATDKDAFETRFDQLDQARQAEVMAGYAELKNHILVREMRSFADQEPVLFYRQVQAMIRDKARLGIGDDEAFAAINTAPDLQDLYWEGVKQEEAQAKWEEEAATAWVPAEGDLAAVMSLNQANVKDTGDGGTVGYTCAGFLVLVGPGHDAAYVQWVDSQDDYASGGITVEKGGFMSGKGTLTVTGCPPAKQGVVQDALERFSDKEIAFA